MDGLRKVPDNVPNGAMLAEPSRQAAEPHPRSVRRVKRRATVSPRTTTPAARIPRPVRLRLRVRVVERLLRGRRISTTRCDRACCRIIRRSSTSCCRRCARNGAQTYSPVLPISPTSGKSCCRSRSRWSTPTRARSASPTRDGSVIEQSALGGQAKLQWKVDWAMRWVCARRRLRDVRQGPDRFGVQSVRRSRACSAGARPKGFIYEMFLDEQWREDLQVQGQRAQRSTNG
jgi:lysyl-tRNA synthetase, class I